MTQGPTPTERFERVLAFASDEADGLGHGFITCQHLLYALACENKGLAHAVLNDLGGTTEAIHTVLADTAAPHDRTGEAFLELSMEAQQALERAVMVAAWWGHRWLDTEHLLHALAVERTSADDVFAALRIDPAQIIERLANAKESAPPAAIREEAVHAYRFTLETAWLLSTATDAANRSNSPAVNSLHLLVALLTLESPVRRLFAKEYDITAEALARLLESPAAGLQRSGRVPLSGDVQRILGYAIGEAWNRGHQAVKPIHVAMGLARGDRCAALDLLAELGVPQATLIEALEAVMPPPVKR